ncbi:MAG: hypothetical protein SGI77_18940 [Pirellulaceae bacterium]|nr:hypothetical protein [Pirellulaceae bacterium]
MPETELESWPRPHFVQLPLSGLYFFVVYGALEETYPTIPQQEYQSNGLPNGLQLLYHSLGERAELRMHFQHGASWENFCRESPIVVDALQQSPTCLALRGELPDANHLDSLRDCIGLIMYLLDHGGTAVVDVLTGNWYGPLDWRLKVFDGGIAGSNSLITFQSIEEQPGKRHLYTRGMRRFARPDLSIENVDAADESSRQAILEYLAQSMIAGGSIPNGQALSFPELGIEFTCHWQGGLEDPKFYNFYIRLTAIHKKGSSAESVGQN